MQVTETFSERLARLVREKGLSITEVASILEMSEMQAKRVLEGSTQSLKLVPALRLSRRLGVTPFYLAGEPEVSATPEQIEEDAILRMRAVLKTLQGQQQALVAQQTAFRQLLEVLLARKVLPEPDREKLLKTLGRER